MLLHPFYYIYHPFSIYITLSKFLTSKGFQRSNNNPFIEASVRGAARAVSAARREHGGGDAQPRNGQGARGLPLASFC